MTRKEIIDIHSLVVKEDEKTYVLAGKELLALKGIKAEPTVQQGLELLTLLFYSFLNLNQYYDAALLAWGNVKFDPEPIEVQKIWNTILESHKVLILGGGSLGKTYSGIALKLLQWSEDPEYTNFKVISSTEGHAKSNTWGTLKGFHQDSIIPLPGIMKDDILEWKNGTKDSAIALLAIPQGDEGKGRLQGFHPKPRRTIHPKFGRLSRVGAFIDEAETVPEGLWKGVDNLLTAQTPEGNVTIFGATNPENINSSFAMRAEPNKGWDSVDEDKDFEWESTMGWRVVRLDAKYTENVKQRKMVYLGLQTYDGYKDLERLGTSHPTYWTMGRGIYPRANVEYNIIPAGHLKNSRAILNFVSEVTPIASLDPAFAPEGDDAILTAARAGIADGIRGMDVEIRFIEPHFCIQIEQQFPIKKDNTSYMADDVMTKLGMLRVRPEWFVMDKSGNALGLYDLMRLHFGDILGVQWNEDATDKRILQEDSLIASERYRGIDTEMWFSFARWLEYEHVKFLPLLDTKTLFSEFTARQFQTRGKLYKVESKADYKRNNPGRTSPDHADSCIMLVHLCRMRGMNQPSLIPPSPPRKPETDWIFPKRSSGSGALPFINFKD